MSIWIGGGEGGEEEAISSKEWLRKVGWHCTVIVCCMSISLLDHGQTTEHRDGVSVIFVHLLASIVPPVEWPYNITSR